MKLRKPIWTPFEPTDPEFDPTGARIYVNSRYQVAIKGFSTHDPFGRVVELSLKRRDKEPIYDWRDMQKIKNDFFGPAATMIQVFPPEKWLVDTSNQYYFYVLLDYELPFGFKERLVSERSGQTTAVTNAVGVPAAFGSASVMAVPLAWIEAVFCCTSE
jgi:hypothetical protein